MIRERPVVTALIGAAGVVVAAVITVLASQDPAPSPQPPPSTTTSATTGEPDARLWAFLPHEAVSNCVPGERPFGAFARVRCSATPAKDRVAADIDFYLYDGFASSRRAFDALVPANVTVSSRVCPDAPDRSDYNLPALSSAGMLACYVDQPTQTPRIVWTRDDPGIVAMVVGAQDATVAQLWQVWLTVPINGPSTSPSGPATS